MSARLPVNALTVDVEDYFQVSAFAPRIARSELTTRECRVERNVDRLLELFARHAARATFFTLGWVAERYPGLVRDIVAAGHELASHGYGHERAHDQTPEAFLADVRLAKLIWKTSPARRSRAIAPPAFPSGCAIPGPSTF